eukprot:11708730-Prorocentrum_lima.AAC.1
MGLERNAAMPPLFKAGGGSSLRLLTRIDDGYGAGTVQEIMSFRKEFGKRATHKFQGPVAVGGRY